MKRRVLILGAALALVVAGCGSDSTRPVTTVPAVLSLVFDTPDDTTGALLLRVSGGPVDSVVENGTGTYGAAAVDASGASVMVTGSLLNGAVVARVYIPDADAAGNYRVVVDEAAYRGTNVQQAPPTGTVRLVMP